MYLATFSYCEHAIRKYCELTHHQNLQSKIQNWRVFFQNLNFPQPNTTNLCPQPLKLSNFLGFSPKAPPCLLQVCWDLGYMHSLLLSTKSQLVSTSTIYSTPPKTMGDRQCAAADAKETQENTHQPLLPNRYPLPSRILSQFAPFSLLPWNLAAVSGSSSLPKASGHHNSMTDEGDVEPPNIWGFPQNPSIGLRLLTPIVPASDNKPALFLVTTAQLLMGLTLMTRRVPGVGETLVRARTASVFRYMAGCGLVIMSGLEYGRLLVPYDPWYEEARQWRQWAVRHSLNPSWWFGGIWWYTPMAMDQWRLKTSRWINNAANVLELEPESPNAGNSVLASIAIGPHARLKPGESNTYHDIYTNLRQINTKRTRDLLEGDLAKVTELNKAQRLDDLMEGKGPVHLNEEFTKAHIQLGHFTLEPDWEFEMAWGNFEPWAEMDRDIDIRLVPTWRRDDESE